MSGNRRLGPTMKVGSRILWRVALGMCVAGVEAMPGVAQAPPSDTAATGWLQPETLATSPYERMSALLEVTIFNIDVLTLSVAVTPEVGARLRALTEGERYSEELADSVAAVMLGVDDAWARQVFHRDVSLGRMLGGMRETTQKAAEAGFISRAYADRFASDLPVLFDFLREDGAKEGDEIVFRIRGDTVRTVYRTVDGRVLMDSSGEDAEGRRASIPSFFAPDTRFRRRLVESLLRLSDADAGN